jgi:K+-sensing histidine kinase KdpD
MWMYLCKKIVELHRGNISAGNWEYLAWASFKIVIPINID